jgi:hypothetical protein
VEGAFVEAGEAVVSAFRGGEKRRGHGAERPRERTSLGSMRRLEGRVGRFLGESKKHIFVEAAEAGSLDN